MSARTRTRTQRAQGTQRSPIGRSHRIFATFAAFAFLVTASGRVVWTASSPVADAAMRGDRDNVRTLLKQGADANAARGDGMTALHYAAQRGDADLAAMLIYAGANVSSVTRIGAYTPLHLASQSGSLPVVQALLKAGADVKARTNTTGVTPLHLAAEAGNA